MMLHRPFALVLLCTSCFTVLLATPAAAQQEYDLSIQHVGAVGDTYDFVCVVSNSEQSKSYINGELFDESLVERSIELEGQVEFLAVDASGAVTRMAFHLDTAEVEADGEPIEMDVSRPLILELTGFFPLLFYENGGAVAPEISTQLIEALNQIGGGLYGDPEHGDVLIRAIGVDTPRTLGSRWGMDYETYFVEASEGAFPIEFDDEQTEGLAHFNEVNEEVYGEAVAMVTFEIDSTGYRLVDEAFPDLFETTESELQVDMEFHLALDERSFVGQQAVSMTMGFAAEGDLVEQGQTFHLEIEVEVINHQSMTLKRPD